MSIDSEPLKSDYRSATGGEASAGHTKSTPSLAMNHPLQRGNLTLMRFGFPATKAVRLDSGSVELPVPGLNISYPRCITSTSRHLGDSPVSGMTPAST